MGFLDRFKKSSNSKNFKYLDELIHSGEKEIILNSDIVLGSFEKRKYPLGIELDVDDLVIDGNGHTIDAQGKTRIFHCTGKNIILKNIILKNGFTEESGGAIYNYYGELTITGSTLTGNTAQESGGAIYNYYGELTITGSTLIGNPAQESGGAIYNKMGELTITDSTLTGNTAQKNGGAILNSDELTITGSTLIGNTAQKNGGAIFNNSTGKLIITESTLTGNTAQKNGGAIQNYHELTITGSTISGNTAEKWGGAINNSDKDSNIRITKSSFNDNMSKDGGAIYNKYGSFKIFNCEFSSNKSPNSIILNYALLEIYNTNFKYNKSKYIISNEKYVRITDYYGGNLSIFFTKFIENDVEEYVLNNDGKSCTIEKTTFENNFSNKAMNIINKSELTLISPKIKDKGKSILNQNYILIRKSPPELENKIYGEGTVEVDEKIIPQGENYDFGYLDKKIHESNTKEIILDHDITLETYERDFYEGGIELDIDNLIIDGNGKTINGSDKSRIFIITGKNITLKNIIFKNGHTYENFENSLNSNGGAIKIYPEGDVTIKNCEFNNNKSENLGGVIYNCEKVKLNISESVFNNNNAKQYAGAIYNCEKVKLNITKSSFTDNIAQHGGVIYIKADCVLDITDSTFKRNRVTEFGGAINSTEGRICITGSTFTGNTADIGGAIRNYGGELTITESSFTGNTAHSGGAIYNFKGELTITESTLTENTAQKDGGAINNWESKLTITESTLTGNTAQESGGAIYNWSELTITESTLTKNTSQGDGGAIFNSGDLTITESTLTENTAENGGGAIHNIEEKSFNIKNCKLENNKPKDIDYKKYI